MKKFLGSILLAVVLISAIGIPNLVADDDPPPPPTTTGINPVPPPPPPINF